MKIGIVSDYYYPATGGISEHVHHLAKELRKLNHQVRIITTSYGKNDEDFKEDVIRIGKALTIPSNGSYASIAVGWNLINEVRKVLQREKFDLLHIHNPLTPILSLVALMLSQTTNIATFHSCLEKNHIGYAFFKNFLARYSNKLHGRIAVSQTAYQSIKRYFPGEYKIIPNGVDINRFQNGEYLKKYNDEKINILFIGKFESRKGLIYLLKAFPLILKGDPEARLIIVGDGWKKFYYKYIVRENLEKDIFFEGRVSCNQISSYYKTCNIFCSPAIRGESFGIVLIEAMASGKPIVASKIRGYDEVISNPEEGLLVEPKNSLVLAEAILKLLKNQPLREKMGQAGQKKVQNYDWVNITKRIENYYQEVLSRTFW